MISAIPPSAPREPSPGRSDAQVPRVRAVARVTGSSAVETRARRVELRPGRLGSVTGSRGGGWLRVGAPVHSGPAGQPLRPAFGWFASPATASRHPATTATDRRPAAAPARRSTTSAAA
jgi:hypothetical protein